MEKVSISPINMDALGNCIVKTVDLQEIKLNQLWNKQTAIFIFLRHFACIACRAHAKQIWEERKKYESVGSRLIFVGHGQAHFIKKFQEDLGIQQAVIVTDPTREVFKLAGFHEGFFYVVNPSSMVNAIKLATQGHRQSAYSKEAGTHWQLGGILAVSPAGNILYHYISESLGDFPEEESLKKIQASE